MCCVMSRIVFYLAVLANCLAVLVLVFLLLTEAGSPAEYLVIVLALLPPLLALAALWQRPDFEERKLARQVRKARLRKELKEFEEQ